MFFIVKFGKSFLNNYDSLINRIKQKKQIRTHLFNKILQTKLEKKYFFKKLRRKMLF